MIIDIDDRELHIIQAGLVKLMTQSDFKQDKVKGLYDKLSKVKLEDIKRNKEELNVRRN